MFNIICLQEQQWWQLMSWVVYEAVLQASAELVPASSLQQAANSAVPASSSCTAQTAADTAILQAVKLL